MQQEQTRIMTTDWRVEPLTCSEMFMYRREEEEELKQMYIRNTVRTGGCKIAASPPADLLNEKINADH